MSSKLPQNKPGLAVGRDEVGAALGNVEAQIQALQADTSASTAVTVTIPQPCIGGGIDGGGFVLFYESAKRGLRATFCATVPNDTVRVKTVIIKHSDATASAQSFKQNRLQQTIELDADQTASGHAEYKFQPLLEYSTQYDLIKLVAIGSDGTRLQDPPTDAKFGVGQPLATFTTPALFPPPSDPAANLIITNALDAAKAYRAYATFRVSASKANPSATFAQQNIDQIVVTILENGLNVDYPYKIKGADQNAASVDVTVRKLIPGASYQWVKNTAWSPPNQSAESTGPAVPFTGANFSVDPTTLTGVNLNVQFGAPNNAKHAKISLEFTQPATPVALKNCTVDLKLQGDPDTNYDPKIVKFSLQDSALVVANQAYTVANGLAVTLDNAMKLNPATAYTLRLRLNVIGEAIQLVKTFNVGTGANPDATADTAPPSGLGVPVLEFHKGTLTISNMTTDQLQSNFLQDTTVVLTLSPANPGAGNLGPWFDLPTYLSSGGATVQAAASEAAAQFHIGPGKRHTNFNIRLRDLEVAFGTRPNPFTGNMYAYYYKTNEVGTTVSPASLALNLGNAKDTTNSKDVSSGIVAGGMSIPGKQVLKNGDFLLDNGTAGTLGNWVFWDGGFPIGSNGPITTNSADTVWNQAAHNITISASGLGSRFKVTNLKQGRILPGEKYCLTFQAKSNASPVGVTLRVMIKRDWDGANNIDNPGSGNVINIPFDGTGPDGNPFQINTSFQEFGTLIKILDAPFLASQDGTSYAFQWLVLLVFGLQPGQTFTIARMMFNRGEIPTAFSILESEEGGIGTGVIPNTLSPIVDVPNVVGSAGGWRDAPGQAGNVLRTML